jgi:hypothetical protein
MKVWLGIAAITGGWQIFAGLYCFLQECKMKFRIPAKGA